MAGMYIEYNILQLVYQQNNADNNENKCTSDSIKKVNHNPDKTFG